MIRAHANDTLLAASFGIPPTFTRAPVPAAQILLAHADCRYTNSMLSWVRTLSISLQHGVYTLDVDIFKRNTWGLAVAGNRHRVLLVVAVTFRAVRATSEDAGTKEDGECGKAVDNYGCGRLLALK